MKLKRDVNLRKILKLVLKLTLLTLAGSCFYLCLRVLKYYAHSFIKYVCILYMGHTHRGVEHVVYL